MIKRLAIMAALALAASAHAQVSDVVGIERSVLGSGTPGKVGFEQALPVLQNDILHAPQYLPFYPTAASIWPRVVEVPCTRVGNTLKCEGYNWSPALGRGEYLFIKPRVVEPTPPVVVQVPVPGPERVVIKEVPAKKVRE